MPIHDAQWMLRDGTSLLNAAEVGDGKRVGDGPINRMDLDIWTPLDGTTLVWKLEESNDDSSYTDVPGAAGTDRFYDRRDGGTRYDAGALRAAA